MQIAITRQVSRSIRDCELTFIDRVPIDLSRAREQHALYEQTLRELGLAVLSLPEEPNLPDSVFVEDTALVLDECAVILRPGAAARRDEVRAIDKLLGHFRPVRRVQAPAEVDGGDILRIGRRVLVGLGRRTNAPAVEQIRAWLEPLGYSVESIEVSGCLHLKSAATEVGPNTVLLNPAWVEPAALGDVKFITVDPSEPHAANALRIGDTVLFPEAFPLTRARLEQAGLQFRIVPADELAKAEGGLTCGSIIFSA